MKTIIANGGERILVDDADHGMVSAHPWFIDSRGYARTRVPGAPTAVAMHRMLMGLADGDRQVVDHVNGVRTDNRRENLRICTFGENSRNQGLRSNNTSGYKGVQWMKAKKKWQAKICVNRVQKHLGLFETAEEAHAAYCRAAVELHGEFANFGRKTACTREKSA